MMELSASPDISHFDALLKKLIHPLLDTRFRATKNLSFKIKNQLIRDTPGNYEFSECLLGNIALSLNISSEELGNGDMTSLQKRKVEFQIQQLLDLISQLISCVVESKHVENLSLTSIVSSLQSLVVCNNIGKVISSRSQQVRNQD